MIPSTRGITPLRQRMIDDMRMRKLGPKTQTAYIPRWPVKIPRLWSLQNPPPEARLTVQ